jgi:prefoldin subunit 5
MSDVVEMAEAHLLNVQREIQTLSERKVQIEQEIEKLTSYLNEGVQELQVVKSKADAVLIDSEDTSNQKIIT